LPEFTNFWNLVRSLAYVLVAPRRKQAERLLGLSDLRGITIQRGLLLALQGTTSAALVTTTHFPACLVVVKKSLEMSECT
jgi:hypothetical protein